jgi:RNA recognition motif-containing protein
MGLGGTTAPGFNFPFSQLPTATGVVSSAASFH